MQTDSDWLAPDGADTLYLPSGAVYAVHEGKLAKEPAPEDHEMLVLMGCTPPGAVPAEPTAQPEPASDGTPAPADIAGL